MSTKLFELRPDINLLNPDFNGYKLSLEKNPILKKDFEISVDRVLPNSEQYSLLHARLFGLHNHMFTDQYHDSNVYFIDSNWNVQNISMHKITGRLNAIEKVWEIPHRTERKAGNEAGNYNISLHFTSHDLAVLSDGAGTLHIVKTDDRSEANSWQSVFSDEVLESDKSFIVQDAVYKTVENGPNELHCLLTNIERSENSDKFSTVINWVTLTETNDSKWGQVSLRILKGFGCFYYCALESNCKYIYIASDKPFKFVLDSENPIVKPESKADDQPKIYTWIQTEHDITVRFNVRTNCDRTDFNISAALKTLLVKYKDTVLLRGQLHHEIDTDLTTWTITNDGLLEIILNKTETGLMWQDLIPGDASGEQLIDPSIVAEVHQRLAHLCSESEVPAETGPSFSTQQIEECDFDDDNTAIFERLCTRTHEVTHRTNLGSHQVVMSIKLGADFPPSLVIRHDVDGIIWTPQEESNNQWSFKHDGTLLAFGYVQASKQQRKFSSCSPYLTYSVICESSRHVFVYRQNKSVTSGELRNRRSGQRIGTIAEQQVISLDNDEILGLSATNEVLYLLTEHYILAIKIQCLENF